MHKDPASGNTPALSRRALFSALPFAVISAPRVAETTLIRTLLAQHQSIRAEADEFINSSVVPLEDAELDRRFYNRLDQVEKEIVAYPSRCAADLAAKMVVAHCYGAFSCLCWETDPVWVEARELLSL